MNKFKDENFIKLLERNFFRTAYAYSEEIFKTIWNLYRSKEIKINVNEINSIGENLPMIALKAQNSHHLDLILAEFIEELDFNIEDLSGDTFTHRFAFCQQMVRCTALIKKYPVLGTVLNNQMNQENNAGVTPMDNLAALCPYAECDEEFMNFFVQHISFGNLQKNMHKLVKSFTLIKNLVEHFPSILKDNGNVFDVFRETISSDNREVLCYFLGIFSKNLHKVKSAENAKNILHLVCETNDSNLVNLVVKSLNDTAMRVLASELADSKKPFELLSGLNKILFSNCF